MYGWADSRSWGLGATPSPAVSVALQNAAASSGVPVSLLNSLASTESSYNPAAVSSKGAQGLLQLMPATGASLGVTDPFDPAQNAAAGARYLRSLYDQYGDWNTALVAYNEGPGNYAKYGAFASSQQYADSILKNSGVSPILAVPSDPSQGSVAPSFDTLGVDSSLFDLSTVDSGTASGLSPLVWAGIGAAALLGLWAVS